MFRFLNSMELDGIKIPSDFCPIILGNHSHNFGASIQNGFNFWQHFFSSNPGRILVLENLDNILVYNYNKCLNTKLGSNCVNGAQILAQF